MKTLSLEHIKQIQNGDNAPLAEIYLKNKSYCLSILSKKKIYRLQDIEDAYQEAIFILRTKIMEEKFEGKNVASYLLTVTWNLLRNQYRRSKRLISLDGSDIELYFLQKIDENDDSIAKRKLQIIQKALEGLSPGCQEFLKKYYQEGMSLKQMYESPDSKYTTYDSIKSTKSRCCKKFKKQLKEVLDNNHIHKYI